MKYPSLFSFNAKGLERFDGAFTRRVLDCSLDPLDSDLVAPVPNSLPFLSSDYDNAKAMARSIISAFGTNSVIDYLPESGLWAWLTFVLHEQLFRRDSAGQWMVGERHRWYPSNPNDWQKSQRHLVRMPVHLLHTFGDDADHLLCGETNLMPEIREQLASQKDMFSRVFLRVGRLLYFDDMKGRLKRGASGREGGSARRLARLRQQLDVTWDLDDLEPEQIISMLPPEFDRFKPTASN